MTTPYGVTRHSARDYIRQELKGVSLEKGELTEIVKAIYDFGVKEIFSGPVLCMNFIQGAVKEQIKSGKEVITWITPSGFPVVQNLRIIQTERIATKLLGTTLTANIARQEPGPVDIDHHVSASAPNVIHSLEMTKYEIEDVSEAANVVREADHYHQQMLNILHSEGN